MAEPKIFIFRVSQALFPSIYEPTVYSPDDRKVYGVSVIARELPAELRDYAKVILPHGDETEVTVSIRDRVTPRVVLEYRGQLDYDQRAILQCARDANLRLNMLLTKIPMELAVTIIQRKAYRDAAPINRLVLMAVKVNYDDMIRRYDELCAEYFTGG